jgi:hypothetical protein
LVVAPKRDTATVRIELREFKVNSLRLLPRDHPLNVLLSATPDTLTAAELDAQIDGWLALLDD